MKVLNSKGGIDPDLCELLGLTILFFNNVEKLCFITLKRLVCHTTSIKNYSFAFSTGLNGTELIKGADGIPRVWLCVAP